MADLELIAKLASLLASVAWRGAAERSSARSLRDRFPSPNFD